MSLRRAPLRWACAVALVAWAPAFGPARLHAASEPATSALAVSSTPQPIQIPSRDGTLISGWWLRADESALGATASGARGVVIALHGCGGLYAAGREQAGQLTQRHGGLAQRLRAEGWHVVLPDSLTARGERSLCEQRIGQRKVVQRHRRDDVLGTLQWLKQQPWADASRVALVGWSHGGSAVLAATDLRDAAVRDAAVRPSTAIAFYPGCSEALRAGYQPSAPLLMLVGEKDDWTPAEPCVRLATATGTQVTVYPDSHHGFDNPVGSVRHLPNVPNGANPGQGVHAGRNPVTGPQAWNDAIARLREAFAR